MSINMTIMSIITTIIMTIIIILPWEFIKAIFDVWRSLAGPCHDGMLLEYRGRLRTLQARREIKLRVTRGTGHGEGHTGGGLGPAGTGLALKGGRDGGRKGLEGGTIMGRGTASQPAGRWGAEAGSIDS